jgi:hypothetical protein
MSRLILGMFLALAAPAAAQDAATEQEKLLSGPMHFCGNLFAVDLAADEKASWQRGPDFTLYSLQSRRGGFGIYEGFAPDTFENSHQSVTIPGFRKVERLRAKNGSYSYLITLPKSEIQMYLHLYGQVWKGNDTDFALVSRVRLGDAKTIGCTHPTVQG